MKQKTQIAVKKYDAENKEFPVEITEAVLDLKLRDIWDDKLWWREDEPSWAKTVQVLVNGEEPVDFTVGRISPVELLDTEEHGDKVTWAVGDKVYSFERENYMEQIEKLKKWVNDEKETDVIMYLKDAMASGEDVIDEVEKHCSTLCFEYFDCLKACEYWALVTDYAVKEKWPKKHFVGTHIIIDGNELAGDREIGHLHPSSLHWELTNCEGDRFSDEYSNRAWCYLFKCFDCGLCGCQNYTCWVREIDDYVFWFTPDGSFVFRKAEYDEAIESLNDIEAELCLENYSTVEFINDDNSNDGVRVYIDGRDIDAKATGFAPSELLFYLTEAAVSRATCYNPMGEMFDQGVRLYADSDKKYYIRNCVDVDGTEFVIWVREGEYYSFEKYDYNLQIEELKKMVYAKYGN